MALQDDVRNTLIPLIRTVAKTVIKTGIVAFDRGRVMLQELSAEARRELAEDARRAEQRQAEQERIAEAAHKAAEGNSGHAEPKATANATDHGRGA